MNPVYIPAAATFALACVLFFLLAWNHRQVQKLRQKIADLRRHIDYLSLLTEEDSELYEDEYDSKEID